MDDESDFAHSHTQAAAGGGGANAGKAADLAAGMVLSETYRLVEMLGRGGMGEVWKADHLRLPKAVAIKVLLGNLQTSEEVVARFRREAEIGSRLAHPHIVHVFDFNELPDGRKYIAMDYLVGESLQERMDRGSMSLQEIIHVLRQTSLGLQVAHDAGVVHRDLKPDNIFLCEDRNVDPPFRVKLLDFGISKIQNAERALTQDLSVMGTPGYMAPEQAKGHTAQLGPQADQFSLATIAYEMITGNAVYTGQTLVEIIFKVVHETPDPVNTVVPDVPERAANALARAMEKEPSQRFRTIRDFVDTFVEAQFPGSFPPPRTSADNFEAPGAASKSAPKLEPPPRSSADSGAGIETAEAAPNGPSRGLLVFFVVGLLVAVAGVAYFMSRSSAVESGLAQGADDRATIPKAGLVPPPTGLAVGADASSEDASGDRDAPDAGTDASNQGRPEKPDVDQPSVRPKKAGGKLSPKAASLLAKAESALRERDGKKALTLAQRSFREQSSPGARAAMAKAHCLQRNLGGANAMKQGLSAAWKRKVNRFCARLK